MLAVFNISILYFKWQWIHFHACNQIQWVSGCSSWSKVASSPYVLWQSHCYFIIWIHSRPTRKCFQRAFVSLFMLDRYSAFTRFRIQPTHDRYNLQMHLDVCVNSYGMLFVCIRSLLFEKWPDKSCFVLFFEKPIYPACPAAQSKTDCDDKCILYCQWYSLHYCGPDSSPDMLQ